MNCSLSASLQTHLIDVVLLNPIIRPAASFYTVGNDERGLLQVDLRCAVQHVFISYHHGDLDFAENVINRVEKVGYSTWTDDKLHAGEDWRAMIDIAIRNAFALVVIMTPEAKASEYVTYEWAFAWGVGVKVIPLMLRPTPLHPRLEAMQYLDFTNPKSRPWDRLIEEIKAAANVPLMYTISIPLNSPPIVRQAVMALDSPVSSDRMEAILTLQKVGGSEAQTVLIEALKHPIDDVRWVSADVLGEMSVTAAVPELIRLMSDPEAEVRQVVAKALGKLGDITALPVLIERFRDLEVEMLHDPNSGRVERKELALAMGRLGEAAAVPVLVEVLGDYDAEYNYGIEFEEWEEIGLIVGSLGDTSVIPALEKVLEGLSLSNQNKQKRAARRAMLTIQRRINEGRQQDVSNLE